MADQQELDRLSARMKIATDELFKAMSLFMKQTCSTTLPGAEDQMVWFASVARFAARASLVADDIGFERVMEQMRQERKEAISSVSELGPSALSEALKTYFKHRNAATDVPSVSYVDG